VQLINKLLLVVLIGLFFPVLSAEGAVQTTMLNVKTEMLEANYWVNKLKYPEKVIMNGEGIKKFNREIIAKMPAIVYELTQYPETLSQETLHKLLSVYAFPVKDRYIRGNLVEPSYYQNLQELMNFDGINETNVVQYGFTVKRAQLRTFPTADAALEEPSDIEFDQFQESAVDPAQPLLILHTSKDGKWYYVQTYNYLGWMEVTSVGVASKEEWSAYQKKSDFLMVTGSEVRLGFNPYSQELSELSFSMGTQLPLATAIPASQIVDHQSIAGNHVIILPTRKEDGSVLFKLALVSGEKEVHEGFLPYTRGNIIRQAFKMQGQRYGWGGDFNARDCSAFTHDIYGVFGFNLPRNAGEQEKSAGITLPIHEKATIQQRHEALETIQPGATIHMRGHVMLYLGEDNKKHYVIHDISAQGDPKQPLLSGSFVRVPINQITVTDIAMIKANGKQLLEMIRTVKQVE
jgi:hypothetical protein